MRELEASSSSPAALVQAQRGTRDVRPLQALQPVTPLDQVHCKLSVSSSQQPSIALAPTLRSRAAGVVASRTGTRASSARSAVSSSATALHHKPPEGVDPTLWAAAVQRAAWEAGDGAEEPQSLCAGVLELQQRMLSALHAYTCEQPALDSVQPRHPRQLQPQRCINPEAVFTASLAAGDHFVTATLPPPQQPTTAAAASPATSPQHRAAVSAAAAAAAAQPVDTLAGRLEAACDQVIAGAVQPPLALDAAPTAAAASLVPTARRRLATSRRQQDSSRLTACGASSVRKQLPQGSASGKESKESGTPTAPRDCKLAAALQARLPAAAAEAFTAVVQQAVQARMQSYVQRRQEAQAQLLLCDAPDASSSSLTVQQLVAVLARQDAAPDTDAATALDADASAAATAASTSKTAAANERLAAAASVADLIAAAEQHLQLATHESGVKLDLGGIAKAHRLGKTWRAEASARSASTTARSVDSSEDRPGRMAAADSVPSTSRSAADAAATASPVMLPVVPVPVACSTGSRSSVDSTSSSTSSEQRQHPHRASSTDAESCGGSTVRRSSTCCDSSRPPAPKKAQCPVLQDPTDTEMAALPMPCLPALLDLSHEPGKVLQARLERVWAALATPPDQQMVMVLRHTSRPSAGQFEAVLAAWECAAASVLQREALLKQLLHLKAAMSAAGSDDDAGGGISVQQVQQVLWAFLAANRQLEAASAALAEVSGQTVGGSEHPQPGAISCARQLQPMLHEAWELLSAGGRV